MSDYSLTHGGKAWMLLSALRDFGPQERASLTNKAQDMDAARALGVLTKSGSVRTNDDGLLAITPAGRHRLARCNREHNSEAGELALPRQVDRLAGTYGGAELRQTSVRPGAYDAFRLPSLMGTTRVFRKEIPA
jgi:hypothetical protein